MPNLTITEPSQSTETWDQDFLHQVNTLRKTDNATNAIYLVREYVYLAAVLGSALLLYHFYDAWGLSWLWLIPATALAIVLVGIGQHRLVMMGHEASHYLLFRNVNVNELMSNWFCMYPVWSMTYNYRLQHMAHHQHTNDPKLDPDMLYMNLTGQRFHYPMPLGKFLWECVIKVFLWIPGLVRNIAIRAILANKGGSEGPYKPRNRASLLVPAIHILSQATLIGLLLWGARTGNILLLIVPPLCLLALLFAFAIAAPENLYLRTAVRPNIAPRWAIFQRQVFATLLFTTLAWMTYLTGRPWPLFYFILWLVPLGTVFSFLMILREEIQHSNTPQVRFLDSRNFKGNPIIQWAVFPLGQGLHLPHHLFPLVPHYNLGKLEKLLRQTPIYQANAVDVEGYLLGGKSS